MAKNLRWRIPLVLAVIAISIMILYPPSEKVLIKEQVKEVDGRVVDSTILEKSWMRLFVRDPVVRETIVKEDTDEEGRKLRSKIVEHVSKGKVKLGLDLKGGSELLYRVRVDEKEDRPGITNEIIEVLKKRIDPQGIMEYRIQEQGTHRILIQVPGATRTEIENLKERITRLGKLEFRLAASIDSSEYRDALEGRQVPGYYKHWLRKKRGEEGEAGKWYLVQNKVAISGEHLSRIYAERKGIEPVVGFEFDAVGRSKFGQITERNIGKPLAIILDGILYSAPVIRDRIPGSGIIEGNFTQDEVNELIAIMRAGSLPADLEMEMETMVGPSLGRDSINRGLLAGAIGGAFALFFIGTYYLGIGWVANFANVLNVFLVVAAMVLLNATLTLPGIAGLVLILGMGIDSNVLIFERIREERAKGKPVRAAIKAGYEKAFSAIFDSNITTLITGIILAAVGTGPVKGFAWTLILGMIINLFTAVFVTRVIYELFIDLNWIKNFSMFKIIGVPRIKFLNYRFVISVISGICVIGGLTVFTLRGNKKYDIDFTGGTLVHLHLDSPVHPGFIRNALAEASYKEAEVQSIWSGEDLTPYAQTSDEFGIRIKELNDEKIKEKITGDINGELDKLGLFAGIDFAGPTSFNLALQRPVDEKSIRNIFKTAGYSDEDLVSFIPVDQPSKKYLMSIRGWEDSKRRSIVANAIADGLKNILLFHDISITMAEITEMVSGKDMNMAPPKPFLDIETNVPIEPEILNFELDRMGFFDVAVKQQQGSGRIRSNRLRIEGPRSNLQNIKQNLTGRISLPGISVRDDAFQIDLKEPVTKKDFTDRIAAIRPVRDVVKSVYALDAPAQLFAVQLRPLTAAKVQEKIQEDIINKFKDRLHKERIDVSFRFVKNISEDRMARGTEATGTDYLPPFSTTDADQKEMSNQVQILMTLSKPLTKEVLETVLASAGYPNILEQGLEEGREYKAVHLILDTQKSETVKKTLMDAFEIPQPLKRIVSIGSTVANEMKGRAILAILFSFVATILYVWFRFGDFKFGSSAIVAVIHDILIALGAVAVADYLFGNMKIDSAMVAAFLTVVGYSLNDTIIIFDRIRENMGGRGKILTAQLINESINQTLGRTILTSFTTIGVLLSLFFLGGPEIHGFAFVMLVGIIVGTYSTIFIACPMLLGWEGFSGSEKLPQQVSSTKGKEPTGKSR
ncbi:MAG: protein translocase subunit SecD [Candidatus Loosdrechtia sp.]|uniref:protein translocase subunit SecD n=1 Tax=Candidatus Loosdrechtia sp. TaxID=3101272 RepID=UPI00403AFA7D